MRWGTAGFGVYPTRLTYAYPYRVLGLTVGAISRECQLDSSSLTGGGSEQGMRSKCQREVCARGGVFGFEVL